MWKRFHKKRRGPPTLKKYNSKENHNIFCETSQVVFEEFQAYNGQKLVAIGILHILFLSLPMFWTQKTSHPLPPSHPAPRDVSIYELGLPPLLPTPHSLSGASVSFSF